MLSSLLQPNRKETHTKCMLHEPMYVKLKVAKAVYGVREVGIMASPACCSLSFILKETLFHTSL